MVARMKILIGYDGSECSDEALDDLRRAGLSLEAEAVVLSVADVFLPPPVTEADEAFPLYVPAGVKRAHERAAQAVGEARAMAERAARLVRKNFPGWDVSAEACADSPAWALISKADRWKPDLVVVGALGHTVLGGRLILGSVSQRVLYEARSSVRVARGKAKRDGLPARVLVGTDGSPDADAAIDAVAARAWPKGSEARLVAVLDTLMSVTRDPSEPSMVKWVEADDEKDWEWARGVFETSAARLRTAGLAASVHIRKGNPKHVLVEEAEDWGADSIFVGAKGVRGVDRLLLGSVSAAVAARAHCSVEVVRPPKQGPRSQE
jgi:nucleotide-binding universal stress UspA family protein